MDVVVVTMKMLVLNLLNHHHDITRRSTTPAGIALATHRNNISVFNSRRNVNLYCCLAGNSAFAMTGYTWIFDSLAAATTIGACTDVDELTEHTA